MKHTQRSLMLILLILLLLAINVAVLSASNPPEPTYASAVIDGSYAEWDLTNDFFAHMKEAGKPEKVNLSDLFVRYECVTETAYVLVLRTNDYTINPSDDDNFVKLGNTNKLVDGSNRPPDGVLPDFAYIVDGGDTIGWEAAFNLPEAAYTNLNVHAQINPDRTSAVLNRAIELKLDCPRDRGDLPQPVYPTLNASNGPSHIIGDLYLGSCVDAETDGQPHIDAVGDNGNIVPGVQKGYIAPSHCALGVNDEEGVQPVLPWSNGADGGAVSVTTSGGGYFCGWLDFDSTGSGSPDGSFDAFISTPVTGAGAHTINFNIPDGTFGGGGTATNVMVFMRFRLFASEPAGDCDLTSGFTGEAVNGEVEDYEFGLSVTAVSLQDVQIVSVHAWQIPFIFTALVLLVCTILIYWRRRIVWQLPKIP